MCTRLCLQVLGISDRKIPWHGIVSSLTMVRLAETVGRCRRLFEDYAKESKSRFHRMDGRKEYPRVNDDQSNGKSSNGLVTVEMNT